MGILKRHVSAQSKRSAVTIIAEGNRFCGDTKITGKMHVDGQFEGHIHSDEDISIGKQGLISGQVRGRHIFVSGRLEGEVVCDHLHIERGGYVTARVCCAQLTIDAEGTFLGERLLPETPSSALLTEPVKRLQNFTEIDSAEDVIDSLPSRITLRP